MHRIDSPDATPDHRFTEGDPTIPIASTTVSAAWLNTVQEELAGVVLAAGLALDKAKNDQLKTAIVGMIAASIPASPGLASAAVAGLVRVGSGLAIDGSGILSVADVLPVGSMVKVFGKIAPAGTLKCNGGTYSRTTYSRLFQYLVADQGFITQTFTVSLASPGIFTKASHGFNGGERLRLSTTGALPTGLTTTADYFVEKIDANTFYLLNAEGGTRVATSGAQSGVHSFLQSLYGLGDGATTFNVPDERGEFSRGWDDGRGIDAGRVLGSWQGDAIRNITASVTVGADRSQHSSPLGAFYGTGSIPCCGASNLGSGYINNLYFDASRVVPTANENRPRNHAHLICIKY